MCIIIIIRHRHFKKRPYANELIIFIRTRVFKKYDAVYIIFSSVEKHSFVRPAYYDIIVVVVVVVFRIVVVVVTVNRGIRTSRYLKIFTRARACVCVEITT